MSISQIASKYEVTAKSIADWKKQFLSNASPTFDLSSATLVIRTAKITT